MFLCARFRWWSFLRTSFAMAFAFCARLLRLLCFCAHISGDCRFCAHLLLGVVFLCTILRWLSFLCAPFAMVFVFVRTFQVVVVFVHSFYHDFGFCAHISVDCRFGARLLRCLLFLSMHFRELSFWCAPFTAFFLFLCKHFSWLFFLCASFKVGLFCPHISGGCRFCARVFLWFCFFVQTLQVAVVFVRTLYDGFDLCTHFRWLPFLCTTFTMALVFVHTFQLVVLFVRNVCDAFGFVQRVWVVVVFVYNFCDNFLLYTNFRLWFFCPFVFVHTFHVTVVLCAPFTMGLFLCTRFR